MHSRHKRIHLEANPSSRAQPCVTRSGVTKASADTSPVDLTPPELFPSCCDLPDSEVVRVMANYRQLSKNWVGILCTKAGTRLAQFILRLSIIQTNPRNP